LLSSVARGLLPHLGMVNVMGTGSSPPLHNGWHRAIRHNASKLPRAAPNRDTLTRA
jgi:hypothetical protein